MILDRLRLDGKTALVTGCRRGIGMALAVALAEAGADIVGVSATLEASGSEVEGQVTALGRRFRGYACDFADRRALHAFVEKLTAEVPRIDVLVNCAGTIRRRPAAEHPDEWWDEVLGGNLTARFSLAGGAGSRSRGGGGGR